MVAPPTFEEFGPRQSTTRERKSKIDERKGSAEASVAEATAPYAGRKAKAEADKAEADAAAAKAKADKAAKVAEPAPGEKQQKLDATLGYIGTIQRARDLVNSGKATGLYGQLTGNLYATSAKDLKRALEAIANPIVLQAMQEARKGSAAGATGFGALSEKELALLKSTFGSLSEDQSPEALLETLDKVEGHYRRFLAYNAGYDPEKPEGAMLVGLPVPEGYEVPAPKTDIGPAGGTWTEDPELRGVDAAVVSMIKGGRTADQIRQWLNEFQPGLGERITGLEGQIDYFKRTGKDPQGVVGKQYIPPEGGETMISQIGDSAGGAALVAASDQLVSGFMSELAAGELGGPDYERQAAVERGLREKYPKASLLGDLAGSIGATVGGMAALGKQGLKLPGLLEGTGQEALYGFGSGEPGQRTENAAYSAVTAPLANVGGKLLGDVYGGVLRGSDPAVAALRQKYGIGLTPGQMTGSTKAERSIAGLPVVGPQVTARRNESLEQFNRAAFDETLAPIGARVDAVGQKGVAQAQDAVGEAYDAALGGRAFQFDPDFLTVVQGAPYAALANAKSAVGPKAAGEVDRILREISNGGVVDGRAWQQARRQLVDMQASPEIANDIAGKAIGDNLDDIIDAFDDLVKRQAPDAYDGYVAANAAYRNLKILERAVDYAPNGDLFGPGNLRSATRQGAQKFGGKAASARGDRPFNDLVMSSLDVIPEKIDDVSFGSRLAGPIAGGAGLGTLGAASMMSQPDNGKTQESDGAVPAWMIAAGLGVTGASLPYSRLGNRAMGAALLGPRSDRQRQIGDLLQLYSPSVARGLVRGPNEPGAPMPQSYDYTQAGSPQLRELITQTVAQGQPLTPEEQGAFVDVDANGNPIAPTSGMTIDGRPVERDPETGEMIFTDTGEPVPGFKKGGPAKQSNGPALSDRARSVGQGATFGFADEIEAGLRAAGRAVTKGDLAELKRYYQIKDRINRDLDAYREKYFWDSIITEGGGAALTGFIPGAQGATGARLAALSARMPVRAGLARAAGEGALYGAGTADRPQDIPSNLLLEGAVGAVGYPVARGAGKGLGFVVKKGRDAAQRFRAR